MKQNNGTPDSTMGSVSTILDKLVDSTYWTKEPVEDNLASEEDRVKFVDGQKKQALAAIEEIMKQRELVARMKEISNAHATISNNITHGDGNLSFTMYAGNRIAELKAERQALKGETDGR